MGRKKAGGGARKAPRGAKPDKPPKSARGGARPAKGGSGAAPDGDAELLASLLELQERTAAVGRQLRVIGDMVTTVMREATVTAAEVIENLGSVADSESAQPPPVAARPRRRRPPAG